ncbi:MAG: hypothetical protein JWM14_3282 [Chitinophagaceae bacterium]|nr:hypothetical protein [Chitinophagaceae bacterium]
MKRIAFMGIFLVISHWTYSQSLSLAQLKALKNEAQPEIIQIADSAIVYPVTGLINIDVKSSLMGETIVEVEVWVVDSKGKLVYNNIFAAKDLSEKNFDKEYMRYMTLQGKRLLKRRHFFVGINKQKNSDS